MLLFVRKKKGFRVRVWGGDRERCVHGARMEGSSTRGEVGKFI